MFSYQAIPVLVVDDEDLALTIAGKLLKRLGFAAIDTARNGAMARDMIRQTRYGLVVCDWSMPEMSGLDLLRAIRAEERWERLPFLITSIDGSLERIKVARLAGVSAFLLKPFDERKLRAKVEEVLGQVPADAFP
jgi:two-component system, chemotaxis family, chemotaxis protein CheY